MDSRKKVPHNMDNVQPIYDAIYLSPHLDDVALSCGGQIWQRTTAGQRILVVTLMAGDPPEGAVSSFAQLLHARWELAVDAVAARRAEDIAACQIMGADWLHGPLPDCIYRHDSHSGEPLYPDVTAIFAEVHSADEAVSLALTGWLEALPPAREWVVPLTVGHHVDHQLTRRAAAAAANCPVYYYEDYPYVQKPGALELVLDPAAAWQPVVIALSEAALAARCAAVAAFVSQVGSFFVDRADLEGQIGSYAARAGGERLWQRRE
jgi:LmbE family N-acetylglucosaminyl deacetylase